MQVEPPAGGLHEDGASDAVSDGDQRDPGQDKTPSIPEMSAGNSQGENCE